MEGMRLICGVPPAGGSIFGREVPPSRLLVRDSDSES